MPITFDRFDCLDARREQENVGQKGIPAPEELGRANALFNPLGKESARGWFLLPRSAVAQIKREVTHSVTFDALEFGSFTAYGLYFVKARQITSGAPGDTEASYLVEIADARCLLNSPTAGIVKPVITDKSLVQFQSFGQNDPNPDEPVNPVISDKGLTQFNVRAPAWGGTYYTRTAVATTSSLDDTTGNTNLGPGRVNIPVSAITGFVKGGPLIVGSGPDIERTTVISATKDPSIGGGEFPNAGRIGCMLSKRHVGQAFPVLPYYGYPDFYSTPYTVQQPYTWPQIVEITWTHLAKILGPFPGLPKGVDPFIPENICYPGIDSWRALNDMLAYLGCAIRCDLSAITEQFSIVSVGSPDAGFTALQVQLAKRNTRIYDAEFLDPTVTSQPAGAAVYSHRAELIYGTEPALSNGLDQWSTTPLHREIVPNTNPGKKAPYNHILWDSMVAEYAADNSGAISNLADIQARAKIRARDFFRMISTKGGGRLYQIYSGAHGFAPGSACKGVSWWQDTLGIGNPDQPDGICTAVYRHPYLNLKVLDSGQFGWRCSEDSTNWHAPDFRPTWPVYPPQARVIELDHAAPAEIINANLVLFNSKTAGWDTRESAWGVDPNVGQALNSRFPANLVGHKNGRPLWAIERIAIPWTFASGNTGPAGAGVDGFTGTNLVIATAMGFLVFTGLEDADQTINFGNSLASFAIKETGTGAMSAIVPACAFGFGLKTPAGWTFGSADATLYLSATIAWVWQSTPAFPAPTFQLNLFGNTGAGLIGGGIFENDSEIWVFQLSGETPPQV